MLKKWMAKLRDLRDFATQTALSKAVSETSQLRFIPSMVVLETTTLNTIPSMVVLKTVSLKFILSTRY
jgi:hypothetical protein